MSKKLSNKQKKKFLTMFALTGVAVGTLSSPVVTLASTINQTTNTTVSANSTDILSKIQNPSIIDNTSTTSTKTSTSESTNTSTETRTSESNTATENSSEDATVDTKEQQKTENQETKQTADTSNQQKAEEQSIHASVEDGTVTIDHKEAGKLTSELGATIGGGIVVTDVTKVVITGSAGLNELDWAKLGQLNSVFPNVTSLEIETADTDMPAITFSGASWLTEINMPNITTIGDGAFNGVSGLTSVTLGVTDTSPLGSLFKDSAGSITSLTLNSVTETPDVSKGSESLGAFTHLKTIRMDNVKRIGTYTFGEYTATLREAYMPKVEEIAAFGFACSTAGDVVLDLSGLQNVKKLGNGAFAYINTSNPDLPNVTTVGNHAFLQYQTHGTITEINMPNAIDVDAGAFAQQEKIQKVNLGITDTTQLATMFTDSASSITSFTLNSVTETPDVSKGSESLGAFDHLESIRMDNVKRIGTNTFEQDTASLREAYMPKVEEIAASGFACSTAGDVVLDLSGLQNVKKIGDTAFASRNISNLDLPNVTTVGKNAFRYNNLINYAITEINMPNAIDVDDEAFAQQPRIQKVNLGITDTTQLATMFRNSSRRITSFTLNNVTETPDVSDGSESLGAFDHLETIRMDNVKRIGTFTFEHKTASLREAYMPKLEEIAASGFTCSAAGDVVLDLSGLQNVKKIGDTAFEYVNTSNLDFPNVTTVGNHAFLQYQTRGIITEINMPNAIDVDAGAFAQQEKIQKVNLGITDTTQLATMFKDSAASITNFTLNNVTSTSDLESASDEATKGFSIFTALQTLNMPALEEVGDYTFGHAPVLPSTLFDHTDENNTKVPGTITSAGYQSFENVKNIPVVQMTNIASLNKTAFKGADTKVILIPQDNIPTSQVDSFFNGNTNILGVVYGEGEIDVPAKIGSDIKLGTEEGMKYLYNTESSQVPVAYQWTKEGTVLDTELSSEKEIPHFSVEDAGKYEKLIQVNINDSDSEFYHVGTYSLHEEAKVPTDPIMDDSSLVDTSLSITGKTIAGAQVRLTDETGKLTYNVATADETGEFSFSLATPYQAGTKLYVQATNEAGKSAIVEADIVAGAQKPEVNTPFKGETVITGTGKAGNVITVTNGIDTLGTATVAEDGTFSVSLDKAVTGGQKFKVYATASPVDKEHPLDEAMMVTVTSEESVGTFTVDEYHLGDTNITGTYTGNIHSMRLIINGKTISYGGDFADGKFTYYCGAKIKKGQTVTLEALDKVKEVLDTKEIKVISNSEGSLSDATYKLGTNELTANYTGDVKKVRLTVNGTVVSWGGTLSDSKLSYYVKVGKIKEDDTVTIQAFDEYESPLGDETPVTLVKSQGALKTAVKDLGSTTIEGTYEGDVVSACMKVNGEMVSRGGNFVDGKFSYYFGHLNLKDSDVVTLEGLDVNNQPIDASPITVEIAQGNATVSDLSYTLGSTLISGSYEGTPAKGQLMVDGKSISYGGMFVDGTISYYVKANVITNTDEKVTMNVYDADNNLLQSDLPVSLTAAQ